jgi:DDE_Tnp_1-associated
MATAALDSLLDAFSQITDPRDRRGVRHPFAGILALVFLGLLGRMTEFAVIHRWARRHWAVLQGPLGFTRSEPPCDTTLERTLARFSLAEFQTAFGHWLQHVLSDREGLVAAVDGKTCKQGRRSDGNPVQMLNVFAHDVQVCLGQWPLAGDKSTEPTMLKAHLTELFAAHPALWLLTGDALYCQRNLAEIVVESKHHYLFQLKGNQPDILDAAQVCFANADEQPPAAETREKRGARSTYVVFGSTWTPPTGSVSGWVLPVAGCLSESIAAPEYPVTRRPAKRATSSQALRRKRSRPSEYSR